VVSAADPLQPYSRTSRQESLLFSLKLLLNCTHEADLDPVPDPLLLIKSGSPGNRSRTSRAVARNSDR
jgi:hypothetical protein